MAKFKMLWLGGCLALIGLGRLGVGPNDTPRSTAAALGVPERRKWETLEILANHHENRPMSFPFTIECE
tara:strand:- start:563 stop:769 length:207 start_codon:yes stop_codon:yes gene_type:complete